MFSESEKKRRVAASEKRLEAARDRLAKYEAKLEDAKAAIAEETGVLAWLESAPVAGESAQLTFEERAQWTA